EFRRVLFRSIASLVFIGFWRTPYISFPAAGNLSLALLLSRLHGCRMRIAELVIENFRNLAMVELRPGPGVNFITGPNASGKTSLLEAIHFLARVRSFRTTRPQQLVRHGSDRSEERRVGKGGRGRRPQGSER